MALYKIKDFDPNYRDHFDGDDVKGLDLYSGREKIGSVDDVLVDEEGHFRYLVINTGAWIFGKKVLLPVGQARIDYNDRRVYADNLTREQVEQLPEFNQDMTTDYDYEERVRGVYRPSAAGTSTPVDASTGVDTPTPLDTGVRNTAYSAGTQSGVTQSGVYDRDIHNRDAYATAGTFDRDTYNYDRDPGLFNMNDRDHGQIRLYEERLIANKRRQKTGEVAVGKRIETESVHTSVPIEKERVIVERNPVGPGTPVAPGEVDFREGEVARMEVFEETPDIRKEAYVREEVNVKKVVDRDTVDAEDQIRREELDVKTDGNPVVEKRPDRL